MLRAAALLVALVPFVTTGALAGPLPSPAPTDEPLVCEGQPFSPDGFVLGATPPSQRYRSDSPEPYILARVVAGEVRVIVAVVGDAGACRGVCDAMLRAVFAPGLTCPVRILFPPDTPAFVQVSGTGVFAICEAHDVPNQFPCTSSVP